MGEWNELRNELLAAKKEILSGPLMQAMREQQALINEGIKLHLKVASKIDDAIARLDMRAVDETDAEGTGVIGRRKASTALTAAVEQAEAGDHKRACGNCGKPGHRRTTCPEPDKKANKPMGKRACSKCGKPGHRAPTCPN